MKVHLDSGDGYAARCGMKSVKLTDDKQVVTCGRCIKIVAETLAYAHDRGEHDLAVADCAACAAREHTEKAVAKVAKALASKDDDRQPCDVCGTLAELGWSDNLGCAVCPTCEAASADPVPLGAGRCECSRWFFELNGVLVSTGCAASPRSKKGRFAQGHDASLASLAKRAAAAGAELQEVRA